MEIEVVHKAFYKGANGALFEKEKHAEESFVKEELEEILDVNYGNPVDIEDTLDAILWNRENIIKILNALSDEP